MAVEVVMPAMEMGQSSARLVRWLKADGDEVAAGEPLMEIETDKVSVEIESPGAGILTELHAAEGADVAVGVVVARLVSPSERSRTPGAPPLAPSSSPAARRLAAQLGVDLATIEGSGPDGAVTVADVERASGGAGAGARPYEVLPLSRLQRAAAERLTASYRDAPHFDVSRTVDVTELRAALPAGITFTTALAQQVAAALVAHPRLNAHLVDGELRVFGAVHLGIAVAVDDGLVVTVLRDAHERSANELQDGLRALRRRAEAGTLEPADVGGSTFTVSNLGMLGVDRFRAILNPPEVAILAVGRAREQLVLDGGQPVARSVVELTLSADHRALDGAAAARFLSHLAELVEERPQNEELP